MLIITNTCFGYFKITDAKNDHHQHQTTHSTLLLSCILFENSELSMNQLIEGNI